jgi:hypothetical protein
VQPSVLLVTEGSGASAPDSLCVVETHTASPPREADVFAVEWADKEMVRVDPSACEVAAVAQEEASAVGGEIAGVISTDIVSNEVPAPLKLTGAADLDVGGRASPSLAQMGGDLPALGGTQEVQDPAMAILALGNEVEDADWQGISGASSAVLGALRDVAAPSCQV